MSLVAFLGLCGTLISAVVLLPHLIYAYQMRTPPGNVSAWTLSLLSAMIWTAYGTLTHQANVAAPGFLGIPVAAFLLAWCIKEARTPPEFTPAPLLYRSEVMNTPDDTLELPAVH